MAPASPPLILASASPRRRELLADAGLRFTVVSPDVKEEALEREGPDELVLRLAAEKAAAVAAGSGALVKRFASAASRRRANENEPSCAERKLKKSVPPWRGRFLHRLGAVVLAADTVVALERRILGKPRDPVDAQAMLQALSGRTHQVWTGVALLGPHSSERFFVRTDVRFRALSPAEIEWYVATGEPTDKAGAYGIQGRAAGFVLSIDGSYTNVVGLPLAETLLALRKLGIAPG